MKPITTSTFSFEKLIDGGFVYVDKTDQIYELIKKPNQYFLSRPRRFGKSLLVSTFKAIFQGRRELFRGLAIDKTDYQWKTYPVIHLDMGSAQCSNAEELKVLLDDMLRMQAQNAGVGELKSSTVQSRFIELIDKIAAMAPEKKVVILVDEYDKPILSHLGKDDVHEVRDVLKAFYSVIKTTEGNQQFAFITGVSKFSKVSIFSDLNNLTELTMDACAATLLGYTHDEVKKYFPDYIEKLGAANGMSSDEAFAELKRMYDGFTFHWGSESVFNPVSIGKSLMSTEFKNYWFETGTPTFLLELLKREPLDLGNQTVSEDDFSVYEVDDPAILPLLVQSGYLTIKDSFLEDGTQIYRLDFPNREIKSSFNTWLVNAFSDIQPKRQSLLLAMSRALRAGNVETMLEILPIFFAGVVYELTMKVEEYYSLLFYAIFSLLGGSIIHAEEHTNIGRIDAVIENANFIYIFEFKLNDTAEAALKQIHEKRYYEKYLASGKKITLVGVEFSKETRNLGKHVVEELRS